MSRIPAEVLSVVEVASTKDPQRQHFNQVSFRNGVAVASDGFVLAEWQTGDDGLCDTVSADLAQRALKAAKKEKADEVEVEFGSIGIPEKGIHFSDTTKPLEFPETGGLWPSGPPVVSVRLATDRLAKLLKALAVSKSEPVVTLHFYDNGQVVIVPCPMNGARGLIRGCLEDPE